MTKYVIRRLLIILPLVLGVITITFALMHLLPGDPASIILSKSGASAEQVARLRQELGTERAGTRTILAVPSATPCVATSVVP